MMQPKTHILGDHPGRQPIGVAFCGRSAHEEPLDFAPPDEATCKTCQRCWALTQEVNDGYY